MLKSFLDNKKINFLVIGEKESGKTSFISNMKNIQYKKKIRYNFDYDFMSVIYMNKIIDINFFEMEIKNLKNFLEVKKNSKNFFENLYIIYIHGYLQKKIIFSDQKKKLEKIFEILNKKFSELLQEQKNTIENNFLKIHKIEKKNLKNKKNFFPFFFLIHKYDLLYKDDLSIIKHNLKIIRSLSICYNFSIFGSCIKNKNLKISIKIRNIFIYFFYNNFLDNYSYNPKEDEDYYKFINIRLGNDSFEKINLRINKNNFDIKNIFEKLEFFFKIDSFENDFENSFENDFYDEIEKFDDKFFNEDLDYVLATKLREINQTEFTNY